MVDFLVAGFKIDFAKVLITVIYERDFTNSTTHPFAFLIFHLCRDAAVPIKHCDTLCITVGTVDIGLTKDKANVEEP